MNDDDRIILTQLAKNQQAIMDALYELLADKDEVQRCKVRAKLCMCIGNTVGHLDYTTKRKVS